MEEVKSENNKSIKLLEKLKINKKTIIILSSILLLFVTIISLVSINNNRYTNVNLKPTKDAMGIEIYEHKGVLYYESYDGYYMLAIEKKQGLRTVIPDKINNRFVVGLQFTHALYDYNKLVLGKGVYKIVSFNHIDANKKYNKYKNGYYLGSKSNPYQILVKYDIEDNKKILIHPDTVNISPYVNLSPYSYDKSKLNEYNGGYYLGNNLNPYIMFVGAQFKEPSSLKLHKNTKTIASQNYFNVIGRLESLELNKSLKYFQTGMFTHLGYSRLEKLSIPKSVKYIGDSNVLWQLTNEVEVHKKNKYYSSIDGNLYDKKGETFLGFVNKNEQDTVILPDTLNSIPNYSFYFNAPANIVIPSSVLYIGKKAFENGRTNIFTYVSNDLEGWEEGWSSDNNVYYAGEWKMINGVPTPNK